MGRVVELRGVGVGAVGGEDVLDEVVGADREEVGFLSEGVADDGARGDLDHAADGDLFGEFDVQLLELFFDLVGRGAHLAELGEVGDHRDEDVDFSEMAGAEDSAELCVEDLWIAEEEAASSE